MNRLRRMREIRLFVKIFVDGFWRGSRFESQPPSAGTPVGRSGPGLLGLRGIHRSKVLD
jgi:hypothetical protein